MSYIESVPVGLWKQLAERFAAPGEPVRRQWCDVVSLDAAKVGFPGAIGITPSSVLEQYEHAPIRFCLWPRLPGPTYEDDVDNPPLLEVRAGVVQSGMWAYGSGEKMEEDVYVDFGRRRLTLIPARGKAVARFIGLVLKLAAELSKGVVGESFWEVERHPGGIFHEP